MYRPHLLVTWSGTLGPNEIWSTGCRFLNLTPDPEDPPTPSSDDLDALIEDTWPAVADQWDNAGSGIPDGVKLQFLKANWILADGTYRDPVTHLHEWKPPIAAGGSVQTPDFTTSCCSLLTGFNRGRAHRGRMFWPNFGIPLTGIIPSVTDAAARSAALTWISGMLGIMSPGGVPVVCSGLDASFRKVTRIEMGSVLDVQRRRKNKEPETYVGLDLP